MKIYMKLDNLIGVNCWQWKFHISQDMADGETKITDGYLNDGLAKNKTDAMLMKTTLVLQKTILKSSTCFVILLYTITSNMFK